MSELRYAYDLHPRDDPLGGARILRFSDLTEGEWVAEANGTGSGVIILPGDSTDAASIDPRGLQYIRVVEIDPDTVDGATLSGFAERVVHGFFLDTGSFDALTEQNTKRLTFGGAGTLSYWARAVMAPHTYIHDVFTGMDPFDRTWRLDQQSTVFANGNYTGAMLWRVLYELSHFRSGATYTHKHADGVIYTDAHDDDRTESAVPDAVIDFTAFLDSNGNAWTEKVGEFRVSVLDNGLSVIRLLMELGAYVEMDPDTFETRAYQASSHRRDRTGAAWGSSVIRFQSPTDGTLDTGNILSDAKRALTAHIQRSTMWAGGGDDVYAKATGTFDIPWEGGLNSDANDLDALEVQADRQITARSDAGDTLRVRSVPIDDPANGLYRALHSTGILLDDLATVHNGSGQWDFDEQTFPVAAVGGKLREGGDWDTFVDLGASFRPMEGRQFQVASIGSHTHPPNPKICRDTPGAVFSSPLEVLMRFRFRMAVTTQRHHLEMLLKDNLGATQLQWVIDNGAGGAFSDQMSVGALVLDDQVASTTNGPATDGILATVDDVWCFARIRADSTGQAMIRLWKDGDAEPGTWDVETDDAPVDVDGSVPLINRIDFNIRAGNSGSGSQMVIDWIQFTAGFSGGSATESFNRTVAVGAGFSNWTGTAYDGRTANLSVDGSVLIDVEGVGDSGTVWGLAFPASTTCIHGGPEANSGDASVACGKCAAAGNHEHDYVPEGGTTGQMLVKASDDDYAGEWVDTSTIVAASSFVSIAKWLTD